MMAFFEGLMRQVMERQEEMQKRFLETLEKREQDRAVREEAWRRQETARLAREQELLAQERAIAASRAAAVVSFIQKISGQSIQLPAMPDASITVVTPSPQKLPLSTPPPPQPPQPKKEKSAENVGRKESASTDIVVFGGPVGGLQDPATTVGFEGAGPPSSRWPKAEVHALIKLRTGLDTQYQELGPKGPLWEEISARMRRVGYNRSSKRCKEKWENINKYFKKVKESNKKRPEDAKTCPYFHQLDALYRSKLDRISGGGSGSGSGEAGVPRQQPPQLETNTNPPSSQEGPDALTLMATASSSHQPPSETHTKNNGNGNGGNNGNGSGGGVQTSNGGLAPSFAVNKPGDAVTGEGEKIDEGGSDNMDHDYDEDDDDEDDDEEERGKMQFEIQFQRQSGSGGGGGGGNSSNNTSAPTTTTSSLLAMVHQ